MTNFETAISTNPSIRFYERNLQPDEVARLKKGCKSEEEYIPKLIEAYAKGFPSIKTVSKVNDLTTGIEGVVQNA